MPDFSRSISLYEESQQHLAGGVSSNFRYGGGGPVPLFYAKGEGAHLTDVDGNDIIDYALANGPCILGHAPKPVLKAVADTLALGQLYAGQHELELELAKRFTTLIPCAELVRFASSGSEAVHAALRLARAHTGRPKIVKFEGHYHGWFDNIFISINPPLNEAGPANAPLSIAQTPGQPDSVLGDVIALPWNDLDLFAETVRERGDDIAGVIMEPMMCNSGGIMPRPGYLEGVRDVCTEHGIVLIFDEVITGFRVGPTGAQGLLGVTPDLAVFAKAMAAGFPLSCLAGRRDIMESLLTKNVMHGGTYNSSVLCIAAGLAALDELERDGGRAYKTMAERGQRLMDELPRIAERHGERFLVQGPPSAFHPSFTDRESLADYREYTAVDRVKQGRFIELMLEEGVRLTARGLWFLSTAHSAEDVETSLAAADRALARLADG